MAWVRGLRDRRPRGPDHRLAWYVIVGTLPISVLGVLSKDAIEGPARNLFLIGVSLVVFGLVLAVAEKVGRRRSRCCRASRAPAAPSRPGPCWGCGVTAAA